MGIPNVLGALGTVAKSEERRLEESKIRKRNETTQTTALRSDRMLKRVWAIWEDWLSLRPQKKSTS